MEPIRQWVELLGMPTHQVARFQITAAKSSANIIA